MMTEHDSNFYKENCFVLLSLLRSVTDTMPLPEEFDTPIFDLCSLLEDFVGSGWSHYITENEKGDILEVYTDPCPNVCTCSDLKRIETVGKMN